MEFLSVRQKSPKHSKINNNNNNNNKNKNKNKKPFRIVYISNPVKFTARPDQFRAVVQHLTGRHSTAVNLPGAYDEMVTDFSVVQETAGNELIPTKSGIEHRMMSMPDHQCHDNGAGSSNPYGDFESVFEMFGEKTTAAPELLISYDHNQYDDAYGEAHLGLIKQGMSCRTDF